MTFIIKVLKSLPGSIILGGDGFDFRIVDLLRSHFAGSNHQKMNQISTSDPKTSKIGLSKGPTESSDSHHFLKPLEKLAGTEESNGRTRVAWTKMDAGETVDYRPRLPNPVLDHETKNTTNELVYWIPSWKQG